MSEKLKLGAGDQNQPPAEPPRRRLRDRASAGRESAARRRSPVNWGSWVGVIICVLVLGGGYYWYSEVYGDRAAINEAKTRNNIVIIQDVHPKDTYMSYQEGGTGFVLSWRDKTFLVTNIHVLASMEQPHFLTVSGKNIEVNLDQVFLARDEDVAIAEILNADELFGEGAASGSVAALDAIGANDLAPFELLDDVEEKVKDGDRIIVLGNALGKRIIQKATGSVDGLGLDIFRHSARVKPGNSGSPVFHQKSGRVIGIIAYSIKYSDGKTTEEMYAFRFDNIDAWESIGSWVRFRRAADRYAALEQRTRDLVQLSQGRLDPEMYNDTALRNVWFTLQDRIDAIRRRQNVSSGDQYTDMVSAYQHFLTAVEHLLFEDVNRFVREYDGDYEYNFFRISALEQKEIRERLGEYVRNNINNQDAIISRMKNVR